MVVKLSKYFGYSLFFILSLMYFTPKVSLYYLLESELKNMSVIIDGENIVDNGFSLSLQDSSVNIKSIESAKVDSIKVKIFGLYNSVSIEDVKLSSVAASMVPTNVEYVYITHSIFSPLHLKAEAIGGFGEANVEFNILDMALHIDLKPSAKMLKSHRNTLRNLKKSKEGAYSYDKIVKL